MKFFDRLFRKKAKEKADYEIGTAPFKDIVRDIILHDNPEQYMKSLNERAIEQFVDLVEENKVGIGYNNNWSVKVDRTVNRACLLRSLYAKYDIDSKNLEKSMASLRPERREAVQSDIDAFYGKSGYGAALIFADYLNGILLEEIYHAFDFDHLHKSEDKKVMEAEREFDHAYLWNVANLDNFTEKNTMNVED